MFKNLIVSTALLALSVPVSAGMISAFSDSSYWTDITVGSGEDISDFTGSSYVNPGWGGQNFDAERIYMNITGTTLSIGLQTGFDLETGKYTHTDNRDYYAGDLALSFNGLPGYEFAIDFGFDTYTYNDDGNRDAYNPQSLGQDVEGVYKVNTWNNDIYFAAESSPFAMESYDSKIGLQSNNWDIETGSDGLDSYYRTVSFDLVDLLGSDAYDISQLDAHWTMSCGNDAVNGYTDTASVPEPSAILLMSTGFLGLMGSLVVRRKRKVS